MDLSSGASSGATGSVGLSSGDSSDGARLARGATNVDVKAQLASFERARVLRLSDAEGVFSGWVSDSLEARLFSTMMDYYVNRGAWCCSSRNQARQDDGRVYVKPPPLLRAP